ncbi:MAG: glucose/galactose MFS transporter [Bacteroidota bacterium]|nr:MAG: glucose/galactose transporter [Bacteroidetes bacterium OLB12]GIL22186.1 MAG: glucose/galactose MFS transporter [Bacteroidota bacterium]HNR73835.1 sugar MFS transporter [Cyclobacteriaceae bacterium]HNU43357.1 sugar MFS transporter [Cyclobacteriaceae bacterium]
MTQARPSSYLMSITIIGILFFIFGFVTWINGTLIPYLKIACELKTDFQSYLVATAFFIAYTVMAIPASYVLKKTGYKKGMSVGLFIMAIGAILFVPAAQARNFDMFLVGLFIIGTGLALLQTASNPYATIIGPIESAATRISIMGICNKVAGILAGLIFGYIALNDADALEASLTTMDEVTKNATLDELASRVIVPYMIIAGILVLLSIAILFSSLPDIDDSGEDEAQTQPSSGKTSVFQFPHLVLGVITLFLYVGAEVVAGDTIISYGKSLGIELATARYFTQATLACMLVGYIVGIIAIPKYMSQATALKICAWLGVAFTVGAVLTNGYVSVAFIALLGLANSLMWPAIFPLAIDGLGKFTKIGSALLIMAIAGGAIIPLVYGWLSEITSSQQAYWMMVPCYLFILFFATKGYKAGKAA